MQGNKQIKCRKKTSKMIVMMKKGLISQKPHIEECINE